MKTTLYIQNLKCGGCETTILGRLAELTGISDISIDQDYDTVSFSYDSEEAIDNVKDTLSRLGYPVFGESNTLGRKAKSYASCAIGRLPFKKSLKNQ